MQVDVALLALGEGRVDDELAVDAADADAGDRAGPRDVRDVQRRRGAGHREHVRRVLLVGREDGRDDLRVDAPALGEQRTDGRSMRREVRISPRSCRPSRLKKPPGICPAAYVFSTYSKVSGKKSSPARLVARDGGDEHHRVAVADDDRAVGLLGHAAGLDAELLAADLDAFTNEPCCLPDQWALCSRTGRMSRPMTTTSRLMLGSMAPVDGRRHQSESRVRTFAVPATYGCRATRSRCGSGRRSWP